MLLRSEHHHTARRPRFGACPSPQGFQFSVWAPTRRCVDLVLHPSTPIARRIPLVRTAEGFTAIVEDARPGDRYAYVLDDEGPFPDPASRYQPEGVHGPSEIVDPRRFAWSDGDWRGIALQDAVVYEVHVGTFTSAGTFAAATERLPYLADLGITVVELMPVADFPGRWNWGYDGASLFAPAHCYGVPDDLRKLVDTAHRLGLGVVLDVVYNHFGPDGAYPTVFSPYYLSAQHRTPWGAAVNLDGEQSKQVRAFFVGNALHWLTEYHFDGLRLDATHGFVDQSPCHFARELATTVRESITNRAVLLMGEDERNLNAIVRPLETGGWGFDAVWSDDFHHQIRRLTAGDSDGYYQDFTGTLPDLAATIENGWFYSGQHSTYLDRARGTDASGIPLQRMVFCLQNHDQVGNRPFGARLHHQIDAATFRAITALLLFLPETPLLFMGQEWAATSPFLYFTDHNRELGRQVTEGRRREFSRFAAFADETVRSTIPDPQAAETFVASRLLWDELSAPLHACIHRLHRSLLALRRRERTLRPPAIASAALTEQVLAVQRTDANGSTLLLLACLRGSATVDARGWSAVESTSRWNVVLSTEDDTFVEAADRTRTGGVQCAGDGAPSVEFLRPGAVVLEKG
jgi:maltooligosyltrehalose trehalohydrolase